LIARVIGEVVSTQKHASHEGRKILMVQPLQLDGSDRGSAVLALDSVDAGVGDRVLLATEGYSAMTSVGRPESPIDMAVIGVIDRVDLVGDVEDAGAGRPLADIRGNTGPAPAPDLAVRDRRRRRSN
jgi:ethanolamine utilization protein EutN